MTLPREQRGTGLIGWLITIPRIKRIFSVLLDAKGSVHLINMFMAFGLLLVYLLISVHFLPEGINAIFVSRAWKCVLFLMTLLFLTVFFFIYVLKGKTFSYTKTLEAFEPQDIMLLLLPITPIVQYIIVNQDILKITDILITLIFFVTLAVVVSCIVPWLLSIVGSRTLFMSVGLSLMYVLVNMSFLASNFHWHLAGNFTIQSSILVVTATLVFLFYSLDRKRTYWVVAIFFLGNTAMTFVNVKNAQSNDGANDTAPAIYTYLKEKPIQSTQDIFLLVYESYSNQETMLHYGFDNSTQIRFLQELGFTIYPGTYSVGSNTLRSMSRVLHVNAKLQGNERQYISGNGAVHQVLKSAGYNTVGIFPNDYFFQGTVPMYDAYYPPAAGKIYMMFISAILEGEFRFDISFEEVAYAKYLMKKRKIFTQKTEKPIFLYTHSAIPGHSQNSGQCLPDDTARYIAGVIRANEEMQTDLKLLITSRPDAIVIVAGDHGPYLTKNCENLGNKYDAREIDRLDIQDRYGAFLSIKWPEHAYAKKHNIKILQDIFPALFAYLFRDDTLFNTLRMQPVTLYSSSVTGRVLVQDGIIFGGKDDGQPLFKRR